MNVDEKADLLQYVPDEYKTQEMCNNTAIRNAMMIKYVPQQYKTQEMCGRAVAEERWVLRYMPDHYKTQEISEQLRRGHGHWNMFWIST